LSDRIELSKIKRENTLLKSSESSKVYIIEVIGQLATEKNIIMLGGKK
jgi:hypothetical protein